MPSLPRTEFRGIWGAVLLPIDGQGEIDWPALQDETEILCESGVAGVYTNGTAGEFHNQTEAEFDQISEIVASIARRHGVPFQIGVSHPMPRQTLARISRVLALAPDGLQVVLPDWWPPSLAEAAIFLNGVADAAEGLPLVLYNPPHAKRVLSLTEMASLREQVPALRGMKVLGGDRAWYGEMRKLLPGFSVFVPGHLIATGVAEGAWGSYSNIACLSPKGAMWWWDLIGRDRAAGLEFEARVVAFLEAQVMPLKAKFELSNAALDKLLAAAGQWGPVGPRLLWPYASGTPEMVTFLARQVRDELPELFH